MSEIPAAAVEAAARKRAEHYESEYDSTHLKWQDFAGEAREILEAAFSHLRVQETDVVDLAAALRKTVDAARARRLGLPEGAVDLDAPHSAEQATPHPRPVVDREALAIALHDDACPDRTCSPVAMVEYYAKADELIRILSLLPAEAQSAVRSRSTS